MSAQGVGEGGAQTDAGFGAGAQTSTTPLTQGLSATDMAAMQAAGISLAGPDTALSPAEAGVMQPQSMGGTGVGGRERAMAAADSGTNKQVKPMQNFASEGGEPSVLLPVSSLNEMMSAMLGGGGGISSIPMAASAPDGGGGMGGGMDMGSISKMAGSFGGGMADGGTLAPGQTAIVGEEGPEMLETAPEGGATVTPFRAATPVQPSTGRRVARGVGTFLAALGGPTGAAAIAQGRAARAQAQQHLAQTALQNPVLLRTSPSAVSAVDAIFGQGTSDTLVRQSDPNVQARAMAQLWGVPLVPAGTRLPDGTLAPPETAQLHSVLDSFGYGMSTTSKGEVRVTKPARSPEQQDAIVAQGYFNNLRKTFKDQGLDDDTADVAASKRLVELGPVRGFKVPQWAQDFALADTKTKIATQRAAQAQWARESVGLEFTGPKAATAEAARRGVRVDEPITPDEIQAKGARDAAAFGGVALGRDLNEDDLISADEQKLVLKQLPDGSYIGIPKDKVDKDAMVLYPSELLAKKLARKMAAKQTTQQQNARIVLGTLDMVDDIDALSLLSPESAQGGDLGSQVIGAVQTELRGQTTGRATVWSARRSPDAPTREKAIALINLKSLATSVVKALGDVGAISEADKAIIYERFVRIANGVAGRGEAATQLSQLRQMMVATQAAGELKKGDPRADQLAEDVHDIIAGRSNPNAAPRGYQPAPGTGAFYTIE